MTARTVLLLAPERASNQRESGRFVCCARFSAVGEGVQGECSTLLNLAPYTPGRAMPLEYCLRVVKLYINESAQ